MRLIDADALNIRKYTRWFEDPADERQVERMIREAPTIEAEPVKRGEWKQGYNHEFLGEDWDEIPYIDCSQCKHREWHYDTENTNVNPPNFCPNCGAKMDKESDDT